MDKDEQEDLIVVELQREGQKDEDWKKECVKSVVHWGIEDDDDCADLEYELRRIKKKKRKKDE